MTFEYVQDEYEVMKQEDDAENLLKFLVIDVKAGDDCEVNETATWIKWSEEESSRDCDQWMPVRRKSGRPFLQEHFYSYSSHL